MYEYRSSIGQDSHRFITENKSNDSTNKPLVLAGMVIPDCIGLDGNSDADVVLHALTNAISGISGINILGAISDDMCLNKGILDSKEYLYAAIETLNEYSLVNISFSIECKRPHLSLYIDKMKDCIANLTSLPKESIGITATTGEGLTDFGRGLGISVFCILTARRII